MALRPGRTRSFQYVGIVYAVAIAAAWLVWATSQHPPPLALAAGLAAASAVAFIGILVADNGSVFDAWWSVLPPFAALWLTGLSDADAFTPRQVAVHTVVWCWGVRLTSNWARGWSGLDHEDWRYGHLAATWGTPRFVVRIVAVVGFPTFVVALGCLPLYPALTLGDAGFGILDGLALALGLSATALALVADEQMWAFTASKQPGDLMDRGLWSVSRHPNYLGEIGFWVSLWLFAVSAAPAYFWTGVGALAMIAMFRFASIPMLDERSAERRPGWDAYAARTPALLPRRPPPRVEQP